MIAPANRSGRAPVVHVHSSQRRKCDELGLCQSLTPPCAGCTCHDTSLLPKGGYYFAPGAIEGGPRAGALVRRRGLRAALRWVKWAAFVALATAAVLGVLR